jgi:hypothetical protein
MHGYVSERTEKEEKTDSDTGTIPSIPSRMLVNYHRFVTKKL